jgi:hypothetical protein
MTFLVSGESVGSHGLEEKQRRRRRDRSMIPHGIDRSNWFEEVFGRNKCFGTKDRMFDRE